MRILPSALDGLVVIEPEFHVDSRGFFARTYSSREFMALGLEGNLSETSVSHNKKCGTLRGMHYQQSPHGEAKLVRVTRGAVFDVAVDIRPASPTYRNWFGVELTEQNHLAFYIPKGFAHGFITLEDNTEIFIRLPILSVQSMPQDLRGMIRKLRLPGRSLRR